MSLSYYKSSVWIKQIMQSESWCPKGQISYFILVQTDWTRVRKKKLFKIGSLVS